MRQRPRRRYWLEVGLGTLSGILFVLTLMVPDWIEAVVRVDPDQHSGSLEWAVVAVLLLVSLSLALLARRELRMAWAR